MGLFVFGRVIMLSRFFWLIILPSILAKPLAGTSETSSELTDADSFDDIGSEPSDAAATNGWSDDLSTFSSLAASPVSCRSQSDSGTSLDLATDQPLDANIVKMRRNFLNDPDVLWAEGQKLEQKPSNSDVCVPRPDPQAPPVTGTRRKPERQWPDYPRWVQRCWNWAIPWALCCAGLTYKPHYIPLPPDQQKDIVNVEECFAGMVLEAP